LNKNYIRLDLSEKLNRKIPNEIFYPNEDKISEFIIKKFCMVSCEKGYSKFHYDAPISNIRGTLDLHKITPLDICEMYHGEIVLYDENQGIALMSSYDSFVTILISKSIDIQGIVDEIGFEAVVCNEDTNLMWYYKKTHSV